MALSLLSSERIGNVNLKGFFRKSCLTWFKSYCNVVRCSSAATIINGFLKFSLLQRGIGHVVTGLCMESDCDSLKS